MSIVLKQLEILYKLDFNQLMIEAVKEHENTIIDLNKVQMRSGYDSEGEIKPKYRSKYLRKKQRLSTYKAGSCVDLYLTGMFQGQMAARFTGNDLEIYSSDSKAPDLLEKYGEQIFELNETYKEHVHKFTTPTYFKKVHDAL